MGFKLPNNSSARTGDRFEKLAAECVGRHAFLLPMPRVGGQFFGGGKGFVAMRMPCDGVGWLRGRLTPLVYDAKSTTKTPFPIGDVKFVKPHQRDFLISAGQGGAISGLIVEACVAVNAGVYWVPWQCMLDRVASLPWSDRRFIRLGHAYVPFDFARAIEQRREAA